MKNYFVKAICLFCLWSAFFALANAAPSILEVERATVAGVELRSDGLAEYDIWVSHAPTCAECPCKELARLVRERFAFEEAEICWLEQRQPLPAVGDCAWIGWCRYGDDEVACDSVCRPVMGKVYYFPLAMREVDK